MNIVKAVQINLTKYIPTDHSRTPGLHISDIIWYMRQADAKNRRSPIFGEDSMRRFQEMGFLWEHIIGAALRRMLGKTRHQNVILQRESTRDGIIATPDGVNLFGGHIEEYKGTFTSADKGIDHQKFVWWHIQAMWYCWVYEYTRAVFYVWHVKGNYREFWPITMKYVVEYSPAELRMNRRMVLNNAADAAAARGITWKKAS